MTVGPNIVLTLAVDPLSVFSPNVDFVSGFSLPVDPLGVFSPTVPATRFYSQPGLIYHKAKTGLLLDEDKKRTR
jgi:hypothetical protein